MKMSRWSVRFAGLFAVAGLFLLWCSLGGCCTVDRNEVPPPDNSDLGGGGGTGTPAAEVDLESRPLAKIPVGTVIGKTAPEGWSNLVLIATPTLTKEDLRDAPAMATHYAQMFKFTVLARTEKTRDGTYRLASVARGFAVDIRGKDTIIDSSRTLGASIGLFGPRILAENEKVLDNDVRQVARTPTMLLFDAQAVMRQGTDHVRMVNRHALVVDPRSGQLYTFIWLLSKGKGGYAIAEKEIQLLPDAMREQRLLSVKRDKFVLRMPTPEAFALVRIPQGKAVSYTDELRKLAAVKDLTKEQVVELEKELLALGQAARK